MRLDLYCAKHSDFEGESLRPQLGIFWQYYNGRPTEQLKKRNNYRIRMGFAEILDQGCYFTFEVWLGSYKLCFNWQIRDPKHAPLEKPF